MAPAAFLMGIGPISRWRESPVPQLAARLKWAFGIAVAAAVLITLTSGSIGGKTSILGGLAFAIGIFLGLWLIAASCVAVYERAGQVKAASWPERLRSMPGGFWGMIITHAGVGVFCIGVSCVKALEVEVDAALGANQSMEIGGYTLTLQDIREITGPNYKGVGGIVQVSRDGKRLFELNPEKRFYPTTQSVMTEAAIDSSITRDLYVSLGEQLPDGRWTLKTWVKPFIDWIWGGCFMMAIGGFVAISDRRYRSVRRTALDDNKVGASA
jgi:cytochrome c-type biogenesis protein CcmF